MKNKLAPILCATLALTLMAATPKASKTMKTYHNAQHNYELQYPAFMVAQNADRELEQFNGGKRFWGQQGSVFVTCQQRSDGESYESEYIKMQHDWPVSMAEEDGTLLEHFFTDSTYMVITENKELELIQAQYGRISGDRSWNVSYDYSIEKKSVHEPWVRKVFESLKINK